MIHFLFKDLVLEIGIIFEPFLWKIKTIDSLNSILDRLNMYKDKTDCTLDIYNLILGYKLKSQLM